MSKFSIHALPVISALIISLGLAAPSLAWGWNWGNAGSGWGWSQGSPYLAVRDARLNREIAADRAHFEGYSRPDVFNHPEVFNRSGKRASLRALSLRQW